MRIVYMGTPDIAVPTLRFLAESKHEVVGVLTQPDRPKGRGHHTIPTPVKAAALEYDIPVYQPLSLRKGEDAAAALETLRQLAPDLIVVLAYGQLLPKEVLELPKYRCINLHASLLPAYRGAAPIRRNQNRCHCPANGRGTGHRRYAGKKGDRHWSRGNRRGTV